MNPSEELAAAALIAAASATAGTLTYAALSPGAQLFGHTLIAGNDPNQVALTYDDGPNTAATSELLDILARHNARATFFMIGRFVRQQPQLARRVHDAGHLVANHTDTHPWLTLKPARTIRHELLACNDALEDAIGAPIHYFRPPHGARRPAVFHAAADLGLKLVQWNAMGHDWEPIGPGRILAHIDRGLQRAQRRHIGTNILLHDGHQTAMGAHRADTLTATSHLLEQFAREAKQIVTVDAWG